MRLDPNLLCRLQRLSIDIDASRLSVTMNIDSHIFGAIAAVVFNYIVYCPGYMHISPTRKSSASSHVHQRDNYKHQHHTNGESRELLSTHVVESYNVQPLYIVEMWRHIFTSGSSHTHHMFTHPRFLYRTSTEYDILHHVTM